MTSVKPEYRELGWECVECGEIMEQSEYEDHDGTCYTCQEVNNEIERRRRLASLDLELLRGGEK